MGPSVLLVDDEEATIFAFSKFFARAGYEVVSAESIASARGAVSSRRFDAVLLDLNLPDGSSMSLISELREEHPDMAIIVITGMGDVPTAVEAMRLGADNFLTKPVKLAELDVFLKKSLELAGLRRSETIRRREMKKENIFFGGSPYMARIREILELMTENDASVLLQGETGTGKGVFAKWIHEGSSRAAAPFVEVNCSTFQRDLLASELFGHAKGAFTSAHQNRQGLIEIADNGTLFLDEIGDMDLQVQSQLLKVIEDKTFRRVGESHTRKSDFRLISATNKNLKAETEKGNFRRDLYYRINQMQIMIPPLRERTEDIAAMTEYFLSASGSPSTEISPEALEILRRYDWPGNVRELKNVIERAVILSRGGRIEKEHFPFNEFGSGEPRRNRSEGTTLRERENEEIETLLKETGGDISAVAETLGISRATLYRRLRELKTRDS